MTVNDVFGLRNQGLKEEAYEAARAIYAVDKSPYASAAMFWTAVDMLRVRLGEDRTDEARKIYLALERLMTGLKDEKGYMHDTLQSCLALMENREKLSRRLSDEAGRKEMGAWGEDLAAAYLREKGYIILERDWRSKHRDIDIIAQQGECLVFVEVKTRRNRDFGSPIDAINYKKQKNLSRAISNYLNYRKWDYPWRFDVISIVGVIGSEMPEIEHIEDFFLDSR